MQPLKIVSWNVRGLRTQTKITTTINHLMKIGADICFLQETHITISELGNLKFKQFHNVLSSTYNSKQRGVSILINKKNSFTLNSSITDPEGRFVIITVSINHTTYTLANIYGPNNDDPSFYHTFFSSICDTNNIIIAGDFNTVINPQMDRSNSPVSSRTWHSTEIIKQYMNHYGLADSWRINNPSRREYTYFSPVHQSFSRIDFFLISKSPNT